jgi:hypothetical protein
MAMASLPIWLEGILNRKYPKWRDVERYEDGSAKYMPAGVRLVEKSLGRAYSKDDIVSCFIDIWPADCALHQTITGTTRTCGSKSEGP